MQTVTAPPADTVVVTNAIELAEWSGLPFITCQKIEKIVRQHPPDDDHQVALVWCMMWLTDEMQQEVDIVPDRWILVHDFRDSSGKAWTCRDAYWLEGDIILDNDIFPTEIDVEECTYPVDVTHHGYAKEPGVCWPPKSGCEVIIFR